MCATGTVARLAPVCGRRTPWILRLAVGRAVDLLALRVVTADARVLTDIRGGLLRRRLRRGLLGRRGLSGGLRREPQGQTDWQEREGSQNVLHTKLRAGAICKPLLHCYRHAVCSSMSLVIQEVCE